MQETHKLVQHYNFVWLKSSMEFPSRGNQWAGKMRKDERFNCGEDKECTGGTGALNR